MINPTPVASATRTNATGSNRPVRENKVGASGAGSNTSSAPSVPSGKRRNHAAERIDHRGDSGVGGARERQAFFDGAESRAREMLIWSR